MGLFDSFATDIGVDLGTCNTLIFVRGQGIVVDEPSVVAVEKGTGRVVAVGAEAKRMLWRTPGNIVAIRPLADGVISDSDSTEKMLKYFISKVIPRNHFFKSVRMKIGIPSCITQVQQDAVMAAALKAGAKEVKLIKESLAAAIGAEIPIYEPAGHMVCEIGGGTTEISVISLGGMVVTSSIRVGGNAFDEAIMKHIKNDHNLMIGQQTAEKLKIEIGNAMADKKSDGDMIKRMVIKGNDTITGLPRQLEVDSVEIQSALKEPISKIIEEIKATLGRTPPELASDIFERGIVMSGGGSMLKGLKDLIKKETNVPVFLVERPLECVAKGAGEAFELFKSMSQSRSIYEELNSN